MAPWSTAKFRTKTGCRRRRKKCDETRPRCAGCTRNTLECAWPSGNDLADQPRDRQPRNETRISPFQSLGGLSIHKLPPPVSMPHPFQLQEHRYLYRYFASELLPRLVRQESLARYGDQTYMLRLAMEFPPLMGALVSIAGMQLTSSPHWPVSRAIENYIQTLIGLQGCLKKHGNFRSSDALLATVITLSVFESFRVDAPPDATPHITASGILLSQRCPRWASCPQAAAVFDRICVESFVYHASLMMLYDPNLDALSSTRLNLDLSRYFSDPTHDVHAGLGSAPVSQPILYASYKFFLLLADATKLARLQRRLHDLEILNLRQLQRELWEWIPMTTGMGTPHAGYM
ncbi:fungal Zn binuclear cluster domain-containing protein [Penicillium atrosanguineum]|nr:fungal Zn binuclear cluster domain-containing protein [Penicillium atrosanguineum]